MLWVGFCYTVLHSERLSFPELTHRLCLSPVVFIHNVLCLCTKK